MSALAPELILEAVREMAPTQRAELAALLVMTTPEPSSGQEMLTVAEAADLAAVHPKTIRRRVSAGELPVTRIGSVIRIRRSDLEAFIGPVLSDAQPDGGATRRRRQPGRDSTVAAAFRGLPAVR